MEEAVIVQVTVAGCAGVQSWRRLIGTLMSGGGWARKVRLRNLGVKIRQQSLMDGVSR